jgi:hypothetical protein
VLNDSTERFYISKLSQLKLIEEPGENVSVFSDKVLSIAHTIEGISDDRINNLHTLIYTCYEGCATTTFANAVSTLLAKCFQGDREVRDWESNVTMLKSMYHDLVTRSSWTALKKSKEKTEAQGLKATSEVKALKAELKKRSKMVSSGSRTWCGEKGHAKPDCPNLDKPQKYVGKGGNNRRSNHPTGSAPPANNTNSFQWKVGPKPGESHTKTHQGGTIKWCDTCKKWNSGEKAHLTAEHIKGRNAAPAAALAQSNSTVDSSPRFVAGYTGIIVNDTSARLIVESEEAYCDLCKEHYTGSLDNHENTVNHFSMWFLMGLSAQLASQSPPPTFGSDGIDAIIPTLQEAEDGAWIEVTRKRKSKKHLKGQARQN